MKVLITTIGTRGDVQPYLALAVGLKSAGHEVVICTCPRFKSLIIDYGIAFEPLDDGLLELLDSPLGRDIIGSLNGVLGVICSTAKLAKQIAPMHRQVVADSWAAMHKQQPDIILYHPKIFCAPAFSALQKVPIVLTMLCPLHVPTERTPMFGPRLKTNRVVRYFNRASYRLAHWLIDKVTRRFMRNWRTQYDPNNVSNNASQTQVSATQPIPVIHAYSKAVSSRPNDWPLHASISGYWFLPNAPSEQSPWQPNQELEQFLSAGQPPVYFGFGSMASSDTQKTSELILAAIEKTGIRAVISTGWGGIDSVQQSSNIHVLDYAPHDWLFPKMAAVVHHGGAGTTAAGLRAGCPTIICPFGLDQPFWGRCVAELGAGVAPIAQKDLTAEKLANAISSVLADASFAEAAKRIANAINSEDGIATAIKTIEQIQQQYRANG